MTETFEMWRPFRLTPEWRDKIEALAPLLRECETEGIEQRRFPQRGIEAMHDAGLFRVLLVKEAGGLECHPVLEMEIYEALARISVSACWNVTVGNIHNAWASAYLSDEAVSEIFPPGHRTVVAGQAPPIGKAMAVDGGYRITGKWGWGSGISHATWVMGGFMSPEGEPRVFLTPKSSVTVLDNWHTIGMEASGSYDYEVEDLFVPHGFHYSFAVPQRLRGGPRFNLPVLGQGGPSGAGLPMGGAQRAFEEIAKLAATKRRGPSPSTLAERGAFQRDLGEAYIRINAIRDTAARLLEHLDERVASSTPVNAAEIAELGAMTSLSNQTAVDIANMAYRYAGGDSVRLSSPIQRALRDVLVAQQHLAVADTWFDQLGTGILKQVGAL